MQDLQVSFGYNHIFTIDPCGQNGGVVLFYKYITDIENSFEGHTIFMTFVW